MSTLPLLYQDDHLVAVHKPSGLLVHRSALDAHERRFAVQLLRDQLRRRVYPVHRLDKATSGALLFALEPETGRELSMMFEAQRVTKTYLAIVRGWLPDAGEIDHPLERRLDEVEKWIGRPKPVGLKPALTRYRRLAQVELPWPIDRHPTSRYSLAELTPLTGRRHQLRRHLKHLNHPIIGDTTYGKGPHNRRFAEEFGVARQLLACSQLSLTHPVTGEGLVIDCPLAEDFLHVVTRLGWHPPTSGAAR